MCHGQMTLSIVHHIPKHSRPLSARATNPPTRNALPSAGLKRLCSDIPLGHLISASNDHTTHFRVREHPGDAASIFVPGGAKPAAAAPDDNADGDQYDKVTCSSFIFLIP
jgi:hypothetical protein